ncbi:MAG TPA: class I SAM-dependent methyltransferase [Thermoleophilaceae bacterium]|nr:class I SAM-dependent methyltransferase [Thermoleophilaceae bacterium]
MVGLADVVVWHDVECGGYDADLELWRSLAAEAAGPLLEIGCGTGRVALDLAARGFEVAAMDSDEALVGALEERARARGLAVRASVGDARTLGLPRRDFALVVAPMQVVQLMGGPAGRGAMLAAVRSHLRPGGRFAAALADPFEGVPAEESGPPLPDVREQDGWVFSSTPVAVRSEGAGTAIDRLRQAVSPAGRLDESMSSIVLDAVGAGELETEGAAAGFRVAPRRAVAATGDYVGSAVVVLEAP